MNHSSNLRKGVMEANTKLRDGTTDVATRQAEAEIYDRQNSTLSFVIAISYVTLKYWLCFRVRSWFKNM